VIIVDIFVVLNQLYIYFTTVFFVIHP